MLTNPRTMICVLCAAEYEQPKNTSGYQGLCPSHWSKDTLREWDRLEQARNRCPDELPCTLTLPEWMQIIADWRGLCALCELQSFSVLALWYPGQGLTAQNAVPLCKPCAWHKEHSFLGAMERVRAHIAQQHGKAVPLSPDGDILTSHAKGDYNDNDNCKESHRGQPLGRSF